MFPPSGQLKTRVPFSDWGSAIVHRGGAIRQDRTLLASNRGEILNFWEIPLPLLEG
jgi:hypothetical protein